MSNEDMLLLLQCESCKDNLEAFFREKALTNEQQELLTLYTLFCEMRRLKNKATPQTINWPNGNDNWRYLTDNQPFAVQC